MPETDANTGAQAQPRTGGAPVLDYAAPYSGGVKLSNRMATASLRCAGLMLILIVVGVTMLLGFSPIRNSGLEVPLIAIGYLVPLSALLAVVFGIIGSLLGTRHYLRLI